MKRHNPSQPMNFLQLDFCGPPEVRWHDRLLTFPAQKALALLAYLVVAGGRQPREKLAALLWPESAPSRARATLRNSLHQLRATLPDEAFVLSSRDYLAFNVEASWRLDLNLIETAAASQETAVLQQAVSACRGDFLEGLSLPDAPEFNDWLRLQQEYWHRRLETIYERLTRLLLEQGQMAQAQDNIESWLVHNPLSETAYRRLMRLYLAEGNRSAALAIYEQCVALLAEELAAAPAPETAALASQIRHSQEKETKPSRPESIKTTFTGGPLVGRAEPFRTLAAAYHRAAAGQPQVVQLRGEAGMGKSRLAKEFLAWAKTQGALIIQGRSFESSQQLPYQPLLTALRPCLEQVNAPEDLLSDTWLLALCTLLPELLDRYPDLATMPAPATDEQAARTHLFEAVTRLLLALADRRADQVPLILFFDDLQWADAATLDVIQYAAQQFRAQAAPCLLLCAVRSEAMLPGSPVVRCWQQLERLISTEIVDLRSLTEAETAEFIQGLGGEGNGRFASWLFQETVGQPFYLVETIKELLAQKVLQYQPDDTGKAQLQIITMPDFGPGQPAPVPQKIHQLIRERTARLSPPAADLLVSSAVLAQDFGFELLCQVAGLEPDTGLPGLDELLQGQLLQEQLPETAVAAPTYIFTHDKIRQVVYAAASSARRRVFHQRALNALSKAKAPPAQLARHALAAGDLEASFHHCLAAGQAALQIHAGQEAINHFEQARSLGSQVNLEDKSLVGRLYLQLGRAYEIGGDYDQALAVYAELQQLAQQQNDKQLQLAALMARTTVYAAPTQHYDEASVSILTQQALPLARDLGDYAAEAKIQWNLMLLHIFTGNMTQALVHGEASLALAREHGLQEQLAYTLHDLFRPYLFCGHTEQALDALHEAQALWRSLDNKPMLADSLNVLSGHYGLVGELDRALVVGAEALQLSDEINNIWNQSFGRMQLGYVHLDRGDYSQAIDYMEASITLGEQAGFMIPLMLSGSLLAWTYALLGDLERAWGWAERALTRADEMHPSLRISPLAAQGFIALLDGKVEKAEMAVAEALDRFSADNNDPSLLLVPFASVELALAQGNPRQALQHLDRFLTVLRERSIRIMTGTLYWQRGRAELALGRLDEAAAVLKTGEQIARKSGSRPSLWRLLEAQATLAEAEEDLATAASLRQDALAIIQAIAKDLPDESLREKYLQKTGWV